MNDQGRHVLETLEKWWSFPRPPARVFSPIKRCERTLSFSFTHSDDDRASQKTWTAVTVNRQRRKSDLSLDKTAGRLYKWCSIVSNGIANYDLLDSCREQKGTRDAFVHTQGNPIEVIEFIQEMNIREWSKNPFFASFSISFAASSWAEIRQVTFLRQTMIEKSKLND